MLSLCIDTLTLRGVVRRALVHVGFEYVPARKPPNLYSAGTFVTRFARAPLLDYTACTKKPLWDFELAGEDDCLR